MVNFSARLEEEFPPSQVNLCIEYCGVECLISRNHTVNKSRFLFPHGQQRRSTKISLQTRLVGIWQAYRSKVILVPYGGPQYASCRLARSTWLLVRTSTILDMDPVGACSLLEVLPCELIVAILEEISYQDLLCCQRVSSISAGVDTILTFELSVLLPGL